MADAARFLQPRKAIVLDAIVAGECTAFDIAQRTGLTSSEVSTALFNLKRDGMVVISGPFQAPKPSVQGRPGHVYALKGGQHA